MIGAAAIVVIALIAGISLSGGHSGSTTSTGSTGSTTSTTSTTSTSAGPAPVATSGTGQPTDGVTLSVSLPPWPLPGDAAPAIAAAGLHAQSGETLQVHYHAHVDIIDNGAAVTVPAQIGFLFSNGRLVGLTSLHTHDTSGVVHIESATDIPYTLGQVFTEWGVRLTTGQVGGLVTGNGKVLRVYVNGIAFTGDPATVVLRPHQEIALWYGPVSATPQVPSSFAFPAGE
jgi:hypothetical protein